MSKRYSGRKSTIEKYQSERRRVMSIIHSLQSKGVTVPETLIPKQGGNVKYEDVKRLQRMTKESIASRSTIQETTEQYTHIKGRGVVTTETKVIAKGKEVLYELKKRTNRRRIELAKLRSEGKIYTDLETGYRYNTDTGEVVGKVTKKRLEKLRADGVGKWDDTKDIIFNNYIDKISDYVMDEDTYQRYRKGGRSARNAAEMSSNASDMSDYLKRARDFYGPDWVATVLLDWEAEGLEITGTMFYDKYYSTFKAELMDKLPLPDNKEYSMRRDAMTDSIEEI